MQQCLHHPQKGYYARNIRSIGSRGDFTTAPQLSDAPATAIAAWATSALRKNRCRNLIEIGPGLGNLAHDVLRGLPLHLRFRTKLHLVESSPPLATKQQELHGKRANYHRDIHSALKACNGNAVIFSNELVDAFPVRLFELEKDSWLEIGISGNARSLRETKTTTKKLPDSSIFSQPFQTGQRVEVHESYHRWLASWLPQWKRGEMLTIDYGDTADRIYHRRPHGSLRAYFLHQRLEGPAIYDNPGYQDLTADVNFTDIRNWSAPWLDSGNIENFANFLQPFLPQSQTQLLEAAGNFRLIRQNPRSANCCI